MPYERFRRRWILCLHEKEFSEKQPNARRRQLPLRRSDRWQAKFHGNFAQSDTYYGQPRRTAGRCREAAFYTVKYFYNLYFRCDCLRCLRRSDD